MTFLPDVNVWIALIYADHVHHSVATDWFNSRANARFAFCRPTQMGLFRLLTNAQVMSANVFNVQAVWLTMEALKLDTRIFIDSEPPDIELAWREFTGVHTSGSNFWTDAYLAAFAQTAGHTLVSFDHGFRRHKGIALKILGGH